ncbi:MAG TPA: hypothetical protein VFR23_04665 [Jiangellaceae bacterium]|nr:hypothetical protein [Jiangellaceae bacterium]
MSFGRIVGLVCIGVIALSLLWVIVDGVADSIRLRWKLRRVPQRDLPQRIRNGYRPDGSHDFDPDMEPGIRVVEIDNLERLLKLPTTRKETT